MSNGPTPPTGPHLAEDDVLIEKGFMYGDPNRYLEDSDRKEQVSRIYRQTGAYPHSSREAAIMEGLLNIPSPEGAAKYLLLAQSYEKRREQRALEKGATLKSLVDMDGKRPSDTKLETLADEIIGYLEDAQLHQRLLTVLDNEIGENPDEDGQRFGDIPRLGNWRFGQENEDKRLAMFYLVRYHDTFVFERGIGANRLDEDYTTQTGELLQAAAFITGNLPVGQVRSIVKEARKIERFRAEFFSQQIFGSEADTHAGTRKRAGIFDLQGLQAYVQKRMKAE